MKRLLGAVQFLTILPVAVSTSSPGAAAVWFPLVGAAVGAAAGCILLGARQVLPPGVAAGLALFWLIVITGGLHEDGLADVADALKAGRSRERMLAILKDSRIGAHGALALLLSVGLRWQALTALAIHPVTALAAAAALSRAAMIAVAMGCQPAGEGLGRNFRATLTPAAAVVAVLQGVIAAAFCGPRAGAMLVALAALSVLLATIYFTNRLGGVTGDCLGAVCQVCETGFLVVLSCPYCI